MIFSNEYKLLLCCARNSTSEEFTDCVNPILQDKIDWEYVVEKAQRHGVAPLLFYNLRKFNTNGGVPASIMEKLEVIYYGNARRNIRLLNELTGLFQSFENDRIEAMLLKGLAIAEILYRNISLRPMSDIDLLIKENDFARICDSLKKCGYTLTHSLPELKGLEVVQYAHYFEQIRFVNKNGTSVEIHFRLVNMGVPSEDETSVWQRAELLRIDNVCMLVTAPEDLLFHLCIHANQHNFYKLRLFCDIVDSMRYYGERVNWGHFVECVQQRWMCASVYYTLFFANELLGVEVPPEVWSVLRPTFFRRAVYELAWSKKNILRLRSPQRRSEIEAPLYYTLEIDGFRDKLLFLRNMVFPPVNWLSHRYSVSEPGRLYLQHLGDIVSKSIQGNRREKIP